jgi:hypothetical protein
MTMTGGAAYTFGPGDYREFMPVVASDQARGMLHECPICGERVWSRRANADKHWQGHVHDILYEGRMLRLWSVVLMVQDGKVETVDEIEHYWIDPHIDIDLPSDAAWLVWVQGLVKADASVSGPDDLAVYTGVTASPIWQDEDGKRRGLHRWDAPPFPSAQGDLVAAWLRDHYPAAWFASSPNVWEALGQTEPLENLADLAEYFDMSLSTLAYAARDGRLPTHMPEGSTRRMARKSAVEWALKVPGRLTGRRGRPKKAEKES